MNVTQEKTKTRRTWQIRPATADEGPRIVRMIRDAFTPNAERFGLDEVNSPGHPSNYDAERFTKDVNLGRRFFVVDDRSEVIGVMAVRQVGDGTVELSRVAVDPSRQGEGFGQMLVVYSIVWARECGADRIDLTLLEPDHELRQWYEAIGFDVVDTHCVDAVALPVAVMSRPLTEAGLLRPEAAANDVVHTCA
jgi:GNAT superfamily N-acetyltransferase